MSNQQIQQYKCDDLVFHFNKGHLDDPTIPMWVVKSHGVTFYVNHVTAEIPWSTKETPDNPSTKGSIKFKKCRLTIDEDNCATISTLRLIDKLLPSPHPAYDRIIARAHGDLATALEADEFKHSKIKYVEGACSTEFLICDITDKSDMLMLALKYPNQFRVLSQNEGYYKDYDSKCDVFYERGDEGFDDESDED